MDVNLGKGMSGIQAAAKIKQVSPKTKVLMLTMYTDAQMVSDAQRSGADGYLSKGASREIVLNGIRDVMAGYVGYGNGRLVLATHEVLGHLVTAAVRSRPPRLTSATSETAATATQRSYAGQTYAPTANAIAAHDAVLPTTKPQPARCPQAGPS